MARHGRAFVHRPVVARYPGNTVAPTIGSRSVVQHDTWLHLSATVTDDLGEGCTLYAGVYTQGSTPTSAQVIAGSGTGFVSGSNQSGTGASGATIAVADMSSGTLNNGRAYTVAYVAKDSYGNISATPTYDVVYTTIGQATLGSADVTGYAGTLVNPITVTVPLPLALRNGSVRANLTFLHWSWFDQDDLGTLLAPTAQGVAESTDGSGNLAVDIVGSSLGSGQYGRLVVETSDKVSMAVYRLQVP